MTPGTAPLRRLPFDVRPFHRETVNSYSARLLTANFCDDTHRAALLSHVPAGPSAQEKQEAWMTVLTSVTKRSTLHLDPVDETCDRDRDCTHFKHTLPTRFACALCSHGQVVRQKRHFDGLVCLRHRRWLGLWGNFEQQRTASPGEVRAQIRLNRLRRADRVDPALYLKMVNTLRHAFHPELQIEEAEKRVFVTAVNLIGAFTADSFARRFFDLTTPTSKSLRHMQDLVTSTLGTPSPEVTRSLWLYMRPTRLALRSSATLRNPFKPPSPHDYPLRPSTAAKLTAYDGPLEEESLYLSATADTPATAVNHMVKMQSIFTVRDRELVRHFTCDRGHKFDYLLPRLPNSIPPSHYVPTCGRCTDRRVRIGESDLRTVSPKIAEQFDELRNGGLTASDVAASSKNKYRWICAYGHSHEATPFKKTTSRYNCGVCSNREVQSGVNCIVTKHPEIAAMSAGGWGSADSSPGSNFLMEWRCPNEHVFIARAWELTTGKRSCNICIRQRKVDREDSLEVTHPHIVEMWHPIKNGNLTPELVTHGERRDVMWLCKKGHDFRGRLDKITKGQKCPYCAKRRLLRGENDLASAEPILTREYHYMNDKAAHDIFPSDHLLWWKCRANRHVHKQTVQHRRESLGCPLCAPGERILANGRDEAGPAGQVPAGAAANA